MPEIKMSNEELEEIAGGLSIEEISKCYAPPHVSRKCPYCGEDYYLLMWEMDGFMCQKCAHDPNRKLRFMKNKND